MSEEPGTRSVTTVIIPTWHRAEDLERCLSALSRQSVAPAEVIVVWREGDEGVHPVLERWKNRIPVHPVEVRVPGVVAAMNAGLDQARSPLVALTDDDAAPHEDWIERLQILYADHPDIVAAGGRDRVHVHGTILPATTMRVGTLSWYGHARGAHHEGLGSLREVRFLKGVNCSFRREAVGELRFDTRLRGSGAQVHWELSFFLALGRKGPVLYDPELLVDHFPAQRHDEDQRDQFRPKAMADAAFNETLVLLDNLNPLQSLVFLVWAFLVGHTAHPGLLQAIRHGLLGTRPRIWRTFTATCSGRLAAVVESLLAPRARGTEAGRGK